MTDLPRPRTEQLPDGTRLGVAGPVAPRAWVLCVLPPATPQGALVDQLTRLGYGTATAVVGMVDPAAAVAHLRDTVAGDVLVLGVDHGVEVALRRAGPLVAGAMGWNAVPSLSRAERRRIQAPVLLALDVDSTRATRWAAQVAARRLRDGATTTAGDLPGAVVAFDAWWGTQAVTATPPVIRRPGRARALAAAAASVAVLTAPVAAFAEQEGEVVHHVDGDEAATEATGSFARVDGVDFEWFINDNINFATSSSASGAASEASFTTAVPATTLNGGTVAATLNDGFDGYQTVALSVRDAGSATPFAAPPVASGTDWVIYNENGPSDGTDCGDRQLLLPAQDIDGITTTRRVFVPSSQGFARWLTIMENTSGVDKEVRLATGNNLGSDSNTTWVANDGTSGTTTAPAGATTTPGTLWATSFQNYSGTTSSDPRLGHVFGGPGAAETTDLVNLANGDDNPYWAYDLTIPAGETVIIANFATGRASAAEAATIAEALAAGEQPSQWECLTGDEQGAVVNFAQDAPPPPPPPDPDPDPEPIAATPPFTG